MRAPVPSVALSDADPQVAHFAQHLHALRMQRLANKQPAASSRRKRLTPKQRAQVLEKTQGRCHICGGLIQGRWVVDHLFAHALGGPSDSANTLPAHPACNRAKWFYVAEEFQWILKMGVFFRTQFEEAQNPHAIALAQLFLAHESHVRRRSARR
ncbi:HNH endonuclease [Comamonadaceae bacterium OH2545_COT-014]|nr:HNH endonuclease [Comamonadaceae bacterium OH2545_COT-014]